MADYPDLPQDLSSRREAVDLTRVDLTAAGGYRMRNWQTAPLYRFAVSHSYVTQAQADSVYDQWAADPGAELTLTWHADGRAYLVRHEGPPQVEHIGGAWWRVRSRLIGRAA